MDELLALFGMSVDEFSSRVDAIGPDDWSKPTPDTQWDVTALVSHLIDEHRWMPPLIGGDDLATAEKAVATDAAKSVGDHAADWADASSASRQAVALPGALDGTVALSRGQTPAQEYLVEMIFDAAVHSWDLGKALGESNPQLPDELVAFLHPIFDQMGDLSETGMFAKPVEVGGNASASDRLIAATGRDPRA